MKKFALIIVTIFISFATAMASSPDKPAGTRNHAVKKFHYDKSVKSSTLNCKKSNLNGVTFLKGKKGNENFNRKKHCHGKGKFNKH